MHSRGLQSHDICKGSDIIISRKLRKSYNATNGFINQNSTTYLLKSMGKCTSNGDMWQSPSSKVTLKCIAYVSHNRTWKKKNVRVILDGKTANLILSSTLVNKNRNYKNWVSMITLKHLDKNGNISRTFIVVSILFQSFLFGINSMISYFFIPIPYFKV